MKTLLTLIFILLTNTAFATSATSELTALLNNIQSFEATFTQTIHDDKGLPLQEAKGRLLLKRPGKFRWETTEPNQQWIIADGKNLWVYDVDLEQASVKPLKDGLGNTPAILLSGSVNEVTKQYTIERIPSISEQLHYILSPKASDTLFNQIELGFKGKELFLMQLGDSLGQQTLLLFDKVKMNQAISNKHFIFKPANGVDVIGTPVK